VAGEIAIAVVVLFFCTLVIRSFQKLLTVDTGFRTDHLPSGEITLPEPRYIEGGPRRTISMNNFLIRCRTHPEFCLLRVQM
jgi:hypothetical protein